MTNSPPQRRGIQFEVGAQLEARDSQKNWYCATIEKIDLEQEKVLIHYRQWSHRYDEWFDWNSACLRPLERVQLRREGLQEPRPTPMFRVNERVQACWSDCRFYPARILQVNQDDTYTVKFNDGVVKKVKATKVKSSKKETGRASQRGRNLEKNQSDQTETRPAGGDASEQNGTSEEKVGVEEEEKRGKEDIHRKPEEEVAENTPPAKPAQPAGSQQSRTEPRKRKRGSSSLLYSTKRKRRGSSRDRSSGSQTQQVRSEAVPGTSVLSSSQTDSQASVEPSPDTETVLKRQVHLPTTHKYSREPLYRVIKNQPPPILSIELDHNPFKCQAAGCTKSFRKASLLHYHVKYYHEDDQPAGGLQAAGQDTPAKTHALSEGRGFLSERRKENQQNNNHLHDDRELSTTEPGLKVKKKRDRSFLRVVLRKKKKKRSKSENSRSENQGSTLSSPQPRLSHTPSPLTSRLKQDAYFDEEDSDCSTVSAEWSEEELDVTTPVSQQSGTAATHDCDVVRCVCEVEEENDFMIQCDQCLCWQHGTCMGLFEDNVPEIYICYACREMAGQRQSHQYLYDSDWLSSGCMFGLSSVEENYSQHNASKMAATHQLLGDLQQLFLLFHGLQLKISILQTDSHPDLRLWQQPWKQGEGLESWPVPTAQPEEEAAPPLPAPSDKEAGVASFQTSYISSEHCYQKTTAYYPGALAVETRGSELEHSLRRSEDLIYGGSAETYPAATTKTPALHTDKAEEFLVDEEKWNRGPLETSEEAHPTHMHSETDTSTQLDAHTNTHIDTHTDTHTDTARPSPCVVAVERGQQQQWQLNLLDHIQAVQNQLTHRMDVIEKELDVLESWMDHTGELEPPDPLARLPQLKQRIRRLLADLGTVQRISLCCSSRGRD
ncbi:PHD finger protein 20-like [Hypomesus transpacificus]|uniref:PHD finger protein 20-like n=1 Tax=Hypomesus transpacificus TaxID=137520 RepID=UPI001F0809AA|nr:PHD finger protein 20-like [Hypomesus transpacificus]